MLNIFAETFRIVTRTDHDRNRRADWEDRRNRLREANRRADRDFLRRYWSDGTGPK